MLLCLFLLFCTILGESFEDEVTPTANTVHGFVGSSVTLSCNYSGSARNLQWYRQFPRSKPEFVILIVESNKYITKAEPPFPHVSVELEEEMKRVHLKISSAVVTDSALYYCALQNTQGFKLIFGEGTRVIIESNVASDPVYYKLEAEDKSVSACLASDFSNYSAANEEPFKNIKPTRIQGESLFSKVVAWTTGDDKCQSFVKEGGDTGRCDSDAYFETDEKVNFLSLTVLGLRILFLKSIVFNVLMTLRAWMS